MTGSILAKSSQLDQALPQSLSNRLGTAGHAEFAKQRLQVKLYRVLRDAEPPSDGLVAEPVSERAEHIEFPPRQQRRLGVVEPGKAGKGKRRIAYRQPRGGGAQRGIDLRRAGILCQRAGLLPNRAAERDDR